ncbi:hypothetical protein ACLB2K_028152 [Fragaria x ananassa]
MQRSLYSHATDVEIRPLNEEKAVQAAVDLIGEFFVFTVAVVAMIFEVQRSARSEARKEEARKQELEAMKQRDEELSREVELLRSKYEELEKLAKGQGLSGIFNFKHVADKEGANSLKPIGDTVPIFSPITKRPHWSPYPPTPHVAFTASRETEPKTSHSLLHHQHSTKPQNPFHLSVEIGIKHFEQTEVKRGRVFVMRKGSKSNCKSVSHKLFKDKAKNRVDDLQGMFMDLQFARKESRTIDATLLEEQVHQMLREWKSELNEPSPASSLQQGGSVGSFSSDICRLLQLCEEEDDASSPLAAPKPEPSDQKLDTGESLVFQEGFSVNHGQQEHSFPMADHRNSSLLGARSAGVNNLQGVNQLDYHQLDLRQSLDQNYYTCFNGTALSVEDDLSHATSYLPSICPPPLAFLGPKCALWDCPRPAQGLDWCQDYCSSFHAALALNEGPPGMAPVLRPGGIGLKDALLFAALSAKAQGKDVGIPECEGAATAKSPWNAPELFDLFVLEGEMLREWLFFDKPRRAFESGNRKQRSLPDYNGRGWHESRKQVMNEFGGLKRSYYMDPQPLNLFEWHLYEYEINKCDACALYRLELKLVDGKKNSRGKLSNDSVADLQKQMGRLSAEFPSDSKRNVKGRAKVNAKVGVGTVYYTSSQGTATNGTFDYGTGPPYDYLVDNLSGYYLT